MTTSESRRELERAATSDDGIPAREYVQGLLDLSERQRKELARLNEQNQRMRALLRELIDIEGPQPGHVEWARKVQAALGKQA